MPEEIKKDWEEFDISGIQSSYKIMLESLQQLNKFSAWMITIGIATLGFFITILFQIKQEPILPNKHLAMIAIISLVFSIGFGFYIRLSFEARHFLLKLQKAFRELSATIANAAEFEMASEDKELHSKGMKKFSELNSRLTEAKNSALSPKVGLYMLMQGITLFIGIILSSVYMFWYIFIT